MIGRRVIKNKKKFTVPNIIEVPKNCRALVDKNDVVYQVPGDGACGPNCGAAFLFEDEVFGPKLRKNMNNFFADHFYENYQYLTQCSPGYPFKRRVKGQTIEFTDPEELIKYLKTSDDAKYMWSDSEDLTVLADMYQIRIKIITSKGEKDENPIINWIYPNETLKKYAEIKNVDIKDMVLLHTNDVHFDLIVSKDSNLATMGSLSYRHNIGPMVTKESYKEKTGGKDKHEVSEKDGVNEKVVEKVQKREGLIDIDSLPKGLKMCRESKRKLEEQYENCEKELKNKTEAYEKIKIENQNLKQKIMMFEDMKSSRIQLDKEVTSTGENKNKCDFRGKPGKSVNTHLRSVHVEEEFNCIECPFQATAQLELNKHINLKHRQENQRLEEVLSCRHCGEQFGQKWNLMNHRKEKHASIVALCKNKKENVCKFSAERCWWRHEASKNESGINCFNCSKAFQTKGEMMNHRKQEHASNVKKCENFLTNTCRFRANFCWFLHGEDLKEEEENLDKQKIIIINEEEKDDEHIEKNVEEIELDFQKAFKPPKTR